MLSTTTSGGLITTTTSSSAIAETALQGALALTKSGRLKLGDNILRTLKVYLQPL